MPADAHLMGLPCDELWSDDQIPIDDLTYGVELEVILPRANSGVVGRANLAAAITAAGIVTNDEAYGHSTPSNWKIVTDGSIGFENAEVVSPILRGSAGFSQIATVCRALEVFGCRVNSSTGLHVHVGARDRFADQLGFFKELVRTAARFEPVFDQLVAPSRRGRSNRWCYPAAFNETIERATTLNELRRAYARLVAHPHDPRYAKLNLEAYWRHGTVEFRQHQGTMNPEKIRFWVTLARRLVVHAAKNTERAVADDAPLQPVFPREPRFDEGPRDLSRAEPVLAGVVTLLNLRHYSRSWVIARVAARNPRRAGSRGYDNWPLYRVGATVRDYRLDGGGLDHLRWDVGHGHVTLVNATSAPPLPVEPGSPEFEHRAQLLLEWRERCAVLQAAYDRALAEYEATHAARPPVSRPATEAAPVSLDGLLDLIGASSEERAYFSERQLELNP